MSAPTDAILREAVAESVVDPVYFCRFFLRKWFPSPIPWLHKGLLAVLHRKVSFLDRYPEDHPELFEYFRFLDPNDPTGVKTLPVFAYDRQGRMTMTLADNNNFIIPRGFSKTTLCNGTCVQRVLEEPTFFGVYISNSASHADTQLANVRFELENNAELRAAYGDAVPTRAESERWGAKELQLRTGAILIARGRGSQVRGMLFRARRPNFILPDDVEDEESVSTEEQLEKTRTWFYGGVAPAGNEMDGAEQGQQEPLQITNLATLLANGSLAMKLAEDPEFNTVKFGARLAPGKMLWPYKMTEATYERKRSRYARLGRLAEFCREFDSTIRVAEDALFSHANVTMREPVAKGQLIAVGIAMDPAISEKPKADHAVVAVTGRAENGKLFVLDLWGGFGKTPRDKVDAFFDLYKKWAPPPTANYAIKAGIEANAYQRSLIYLMREEMARKKLFFEVEAIIQHQDKVQRISGILQPRYANGWVRHARPFPMLETQLEDFPNGKKDYADAVAMAFKLMGETAFTAADDIESLFRDEYPSLDVALPPLYNDPHFIYSQTPDPLRGRYG